MKEWLWQIVELLAGSCQKSGKQNSIPIVEEADSADNQQEAT